MKTFSNFLNEISLSGGGSNAPKPTSLKDLQNQAKEMENWINNNPNHPNTAAVRKKLTAIRLQALNKELYGESSDYSAKNDHEGEMVLSQINNIVSKAQELSKIIKNNSKLEAWVQSKLTLADDYLTTVHDYLKSTPQGAPPRIEEGLKTTNRRTLAFLKRFMNREIEDSDSAVVDMDALWDKFKRLYPNSPLGKKETLQAASRAIRRSVGADKNPTERNKQAIERSVDLKAKVKASLDRLDQKIKNIQNNPNDPANETLLPKLIKQRAQKLAKVQILANLSPEQIKAVRASHGIRAIHGLTQPHLKIDDDDSELGGYGAGAMPTPHVTNVAQQRLGSMTKDPEKLASYLASLSEPDPDKGKKETGSIAQNRRLRRRLGVKVLPNET